MRSICRDRNKFIAEEHIIVMFCDVFILLDELVL